MISKLAISFILGFLLMGCARGPVSLKFGDEEIPVKPESEQKATNLIGFDEVNTKVFLQNCKGCHSQISPRLQNYSDYQINANQILQSVVINRTMPKNTRLSEEQIQLVKTWIQQGTPEMGSTPLAPAPVENPPDEQSKVTFVELKASVLDKNCLSCHGPGSRNSDYSSYDKVVDSVGTIFAASVTYSVMPPPPKETPDLSGDANPNHLSNVEKDNLYRWIRDGMLEK